MTLSYIIAGLRLDIDIPAHLAGLIPASFVPFRASAGEADAPAIRISIRPAANSVPSAGDPAPSAGETCLAPTKYPSSSSIPTYPAGEAFDHFSPSGSPEVDKAFGSPEAGHTSSSPSGSSEASRTSPQPLFGTVEACLDLNDAAILDRTTNDLGTVTLYQIPSGYLFTLQSTTVEARLDLNALNAGIAASMAAAPDFSSAEIAIGPSHPGASAAINALIRIAFSQMVLLHGGISVHASAVVSAGRAILFLGPSGTGKSTHARLWTDTIPATTLLNDDNPIIRIIPRHAIFAYGSPWSGKTPCYLNSRAPLGAIVRLRQSPKNHYTPLTSVDAFINLLPSCSAIKTSTMLHDAMLDTLQQLIPLTNIGLLRCRPDPQAAIICHSGLFSADFEKNIP